MIVTHVDILRTRVHHGCGGFPSIVHHLGCPQIYSYMLSMPWAGKVKHYASLAKKTCLAQTDVATYSVSVVKSVTPS